MHFQDYQISNFFAELNKSFNNLSFLEEEIEEEKDELFQLEVEDNEDEDFAQDQEELSKADNKIIMDKYFDINDELQKALGVEVSSVVTGRDGTVQDMFPIFYVWDIFGTFFI